MVPRERMPSSEVSVPVGRAEAERLAKAHGVSVAAANAPELHVREEEPLPRLIGWDRLEDGSMH